jgi:thymidylate synthase
MTQKRYSIRQKKNIKSSLDVKSEIIKESFVFLNTSKLNKKEKIILKRFVSKIVIENLRKIYYRVSINSKTKEIIIKNVVNQVNKNEDSKRFIIKAYIPKPPIRTKPVKKLVRQKTISQIINFKRSKK